MNDPVEARNLVAGEWRQSEATVEILNPADVREIVGTVPGMTPAEVERAFAAAEEGARAWRGVGRIGRGRILIEVARLLRERAEELAQLLTAEMGKTLGEATVEVQKSADFFEYFGGLGRSGPGEVLAHERTDVMAYTVHEPLGVVLAITPWNDPLLTPARKLAPALLAGNAVVLKPATYTPLIALELVRCIHEAGAPPGAIGSVTGSGAALGAALTGSPALRGVSFTGSNEVGSELRRNLADSEIRLLAELGGKNAAVVLADADLDRAADAICAAAFGQAGQRCTATSRVIAERPIAAELATMLRERAESLVVGPGSSRRTQVCPLVSRTQQESVSSLVARAVEEGASLLTGGRERAEGERQHGCYVAPTVLAGVGAASEIWNEEVFGPVVALAEAGSEGEALEMLNGSRYGLAAAVYTGDIGAAQRFVAGAEVGQVAVNLPTTGWDVHMPFGGFKASGSGHKEQGIEGLAFYERTKTVAVLG